MKTGKSKKNPTLRDGGRYDKINKEKNAPLASCCQSRHSGLSGIVVFKNVLKRDDSGQAGMTSKVVYSTFYETIIPELAEDLHSYE